MPSILAKKLRSIDNPLVDDQFILAKYAVHHLLLNFYIEPEGVNNANPVPISITNVSFDPVRYRYALTKQPIVLYCSKNENTYTFPSQREFDISDV